MGMTLVKKTIELDQEAIDKAREIFGVRTDKEAVNRALAFVTEEDEIIKAHETLGGAIELDRPFE